MTMPILGDEAAMQQRERELLAKFREQEAER